MNQAFKWLHMWTCEPTWNCHEMVCSGIIKARCILMWNKVMESCAVGGLFALDCTMGTQWLLKSQWLCPLWACTQKGTGGSALALWHKGMETQSLCGITLKITRFHSTSQPWSICNHQRCIKAQLVVSVTEEQHGVAVGLTVEWLLQHMEPWKLPTGTLNLIRKVWTHNSTGLQQGSIERKRALCCHFQRLKRSCKDLCQVFTSAPSFLFPPFLLSSTILSVLFIHVVWNSNVSFLCIFNRLLCTFKSA